MSTNYKQQVEGSGVEIKFGESNKDGEIRPTEYYLSNSSQLSDWNQSFKNEEQTSESIFTFLNRFIISFLQFIAVTFTLVLILIIAAISSLKDLKVLLIFFWLMFSTLCIIYTYIRFFFIGIENELVYRLYLDGVFFIISQLLVFSYIKTIQDNDNCGDFKNLFSNLAQLNNLPAYYRLDFKNKSIDQDQINGNARLEAFYFSRGKESSQRPIELLSQFKSFDVTDYINFTHFLILVFIILIKLLSIFYYIYIHSSYQLNSVNKLDMSLIIFVYIQTCYSLLRVFGSYDLRSKEVQMMYFTELIDFQSNDLQQNYHSKLDITDPQSLEAFDNARKLIFNHEEQFIQKLDYSYVGLVFYYLYVIIICLSYYFELDWLIQKDSSLLDPIYVIISSGNFLFLTAFLMFRFNYGTQFNNTFQEMQVKFDSIYDTTCDLVTMYDLFFFQKNNDKYDKFSICGLLVKKIKIMSKHYIQNKISYLGKFYEEHQKHDLRKEIILNMKLSIEKVKKSIETDSQVYKYQFMGLTEIDVYSFLFTLILSVASIAPTIIPKFLQFYKK